MAEINEHSYNIDSLVDIRDVKVDQNQPTEEKVKSFVQQIKDPYNFKVGNVVVHVSYSDSNATINDSFSDMLSLI